MGGWHISLTTTQAQPRLSRRHLKRECIFKLKPRISLRLKRRKPSYFLMAPSLNTGSDSQFLGIGTPALRGGKWPGFSVDNLLRFWCSITRTRRCVRHAEALSCNSRAQYFAPEEYSFLGVCLVGTCPSHPRPPPTTAPPRLYTLPMCAHSNF